MRIGLEEEKCYMDKKTYRLWLSFILAVAVAAGIFYYQNVWSRQAEPHPGTLVYERVQELKGRV